MNDGFINLIILVLVALGIIIHLKRRKRRKLHTTEILQREMAMKIERALHVVAEFGRLMESRPSAPLCLYSEDDLPFPKKEIREAIELLMLGDLDITRRNHLEVGNIFLNDFIPDEEYRAIQDQQGALLKAIDLFNAGEKDGKKLATLLVESETPASKLVLKQINERVERDNKATLARNRTLRAAALALMANKSE